MMKIITFAETLQLNDETGYDSLNIGKDSIEVRRKNFLFDHWMPFFLYRKSYMMNN